MIEENQENPIGAGWTAYWIQWAIFKLEEDRLWWNEETDDGLRSLS
jgi:hypothetical protein